jgi:hypothetical protein
VLRCALEERDPGTYAGAGLAAVGIALEVDVLVLERRHSRSMKTLSIHRPHPSIEITASAAASGPLKAALVNWLPWSV